VPAQAAVEFHDRRALGVQLTRIGVVVESHRPILRG
jgi:hypothetical protein